MKKALVFCLILCSYLTKAQGPQQLVNVPMDWWAGATVPGWLYLPADYATSTKNYPVVFFYHGVGEAGSNAYLLLNQGIPNLIANGMRPDNITNPADGQQYSFIVVSAQHWSWSPNASWLPYELDWLKRNYRVDTNRVYVTGLSAGGQSTYNVAVGANSSSHLIAAAVPMSPASLGPYSPALIGENKIETWFFSGNVDGTYTANATTYSQDCNAQYPGSSKLNIFPGGHCCWNNYYSTSWHDPSTGLSIWEWMLTNVRTTPSVTLPVDFVRVDARKENNGARITWKVGDEVNVNRYDVEKSADGKSFTSIGSVQATVQTEYSFVDASQQGKSYYRIKSIDNDGSYKYSIIISLSSAASSVSLRAYPMPVVNDVTIQHPAAVSHSRISINAADGRLVKTVTPHKGAQQTAVNLSMLQAGSYFIRFENESGQVETLMIAKQ